MTKLEVLKLLRYLLSDASIGHTDPEDHSGLNTDWYVDHDKLMKNIEDEIIEEELKSDRPKPQSN